MLREASNMKDRDTKVKKKEKLKGTQRAQEQHREEGTNTPNIL